jgi:hypothetical protein
LALDLKKLWYTVFLEVERALLIVFKPAVSEQAHEGLGKTLHNKCELEIPISIY